MLTRVVLWLLTVLGLVRRDRLRVEHCQEMPARDQLLGAVVHVVGERAAPKWATFPCPCGCGTPVLLSLNPRRRPRWAVKQDWLATATISPSIRRNDGCRSHFWIRNGEVRWCADTGK